METEKIVQGTNEVAEKQQETRDGTTMSLEELIAMAEEARDDTIQIQEEKKSVLESDCMMVVQKAIAALKKKAVGESVIIEILRNGFVVSVDGDEFEIPDNRVITLEALRNLVRKIPVLQDVPVDKNKMKVKFANKP